MMGFVLLKLNNVYIRKSQLGLQIPNYYEFIKHINVKGSLEKQDGVLRQ